MAQIARLPFMISMYVAIFAYAAIFWPGAFAPRVVEVLRACAWMIALAVMLMYVRGGLSVAKRFYDRLFFSAPLGFWLIIDALVHFAPALLLGLPGAWWAGWAAAAVFWAWYVLVRSRITWVYGLALSPAFMDPVVFGGSVLAALLIHIRAAVGRAHM